ncbi:MAG: TonB-dependent receptor [Prevotellaceae bacterium]|jgi:hypothetical protein|nr:TonB-dependent receptor [Prevotellaceae bacterium]
MKKLALILFLFFPIILSAAGSVRIYGYIYTPQREPAEFATVQVIGTDNSTLAREDGYYELSFPITDTATVLFLYTGCEPMTVKLKANNPNIRKIIYLQEAVTHLSEAEVKVFAKQTGTQDVLDFSKIKLIPDASGGGIESLLSTQAGVSMNNDLSSQYSVRGGNYDENSVYVNNIEVYRPQLVRSGQQEGLSFINPDMVSSVSFSAGGFEPKYGDKMASVLDIRYKKPKGFEASVGGSLLGGSAYIGHATRNGKFTQLHGIRYKSSNYLLATLETEGVYDQKFLDYQTFITYNFLPKWELSLLGNFSQNSYLSIPEELSTTFGNYMDVKQFRVYFEGQEKDLFQTLFGAVALKYSPSKNLSMNLMASAYETREEVNYDIAADYWLGEVADKNDNSQTEENTLGVGNYHDFGRNSLHALVVAVAHRGEYSFKKNTLEWGVSLQQEKIKDRLNEFQMRDSAGYSLPYTDGDLLMYYNLYSATELNSYRTQAFVQDRLRLGHWSLTGGVRANYWSFNRELLVSPRLTVAYFPQWKKHEFGFRFSTGYYYQSPFYKEMRDTVADRLGNVLVQLNRDIKAQRSLHFVLGSDYYFKLQGRPFKFTTELYYKPADRVISYTVDNVKIVYSGENDTRAYSAGVDFKLFGEFVPGVDSWLSLSFMQAKENFDNGEGWVSRPNEQRYNFSMFFQDYFPGYPKYKFHLKFIWADGLPFWAPNTAVHTKHNSGRTTPYRRVDAGISRSFVRGDVAWLDRAKVFSVLKSINLGVEVFNLFDISNVASYYWVTDVYRSQHAIPNYLTARQFNVRLSLDF